MLSPMLGTFLNVAAILLGGIVGLAGGRSFSVRTESFFKTALAVYTAFCGLKLVWVSLGGSTGQILKQIGILFLAMIAGALAGRLLRLQEFSNQLGEAARERIKAATAVRRKSPDAGFRTCAALFCAAPLGIIGATVDGFSLVSGPPGGHESVGPLAIKAAMDGLAAMGFASLFGWGVLVSALPVLAIQGTIALVCWQWLGPQLAVQGLLAPINAAAGLLVLCVALVVLGVKRVPLASYLPTLVVAPLLAWWWRW